MLHTVTEITIHSLELLWEKVERYATNICPDDEASGGKRHDITQRETNPVCHFRSTALGGERRVDNTTREGVSASAGSVSSSLYTATAGHLD